jgi:hypothetical protein
MPPIRCRRKLRLAAFGETLGDHSNSAVPQAEVVSLDPPRWVGSVEAVRESRMGPASATMHLPYGASNKATVTLPLMGARHKGH